MCLTEEQTTFVTTMRFYISSIPHHLNKYAETRRPPINIMRQCRIRSHPRPWTCPPGPWTFPPDFGPGPREFLPPPPTLDLPPPRLVKTLHSFVLRKWSVIKAEFFIWKRSTKYDIWINFLATPEKVTP